MGLRERLKHAWNAFSDNSWNNSPSINYTSGSYYRPDKILVRPGTERSIVNAVYNRMAIDVAAINIHHVRLDSNNRFNSIIDSSLESCLNLSANIDQTGRSFFQDAAMSLLDEGSIAIVPVDTDINPKDGSFQIESLRVGKIVEWFPDMVKVSLYNELTGKREEIFVLKRTTAIIENPLYSVMNEPNSTLRRLIHKLNILDAIDEQSGSGKLDLIIQLPYVIRSEARKKQAEERRKDIEMQLSGSKYGIAYTEATEKVVQLNRPAENNLMNQITYLTSMLYGQLGITEEVINGTADERTMLNYYNRSIEPIVSAFINEMNRKFLTKTARTQGQAIMSFRDPFRLTPVEDLANFADKFTRNEILSSNEMRAIIGYKPVDDPKADELRNKNLNQKNQDTPQTTVGVDNENERNDT